MTSKELVASYTYELIKNKFHKDFILGIGTGSTANCFIEIIKKEKPEIKALVSSSEASSNILRSDGFEISELNDVGGPDLYVDGADEVNDKFELIKGGGGAHTREKIVAAASRPDPRELANEQRDSRRMRSAGTRSWSAARGARSRGAG